MAPQRLLFLSLCLFFAFLVSAQEETKVYIVLVEDGVQYSDLLVPLLGSEEAARSSVLYTYTHALNGFAASLTPLQATTLEGNPGVLGVIPDGSRHLGRRGNVWRN